MPQSQLAWNVPWNSWRAFQAICSQLWCSHVRNDGAHSPCLCHHMRAPLIWWADRQLGGRMCPWLAEGCLANLDIPEGRRWATEIPFLKMNPFVQKESHRCCFLFFLRLGHLKHLSIKLRFCLFPTWEWGARWKCPCARALVTCIESSDSSARVLVQVSLIPAHHVTVDRPSHLPFLHFFVWWLSLDASVVGCVTGLQSCFPRGGVMALSTPRCNPPPPPSPLPTAELPRRAGSVDHCRTTSFLSRFA